MRLSGCSRNRRRPWRSTPAATGMCSSTSSRTRTRRSTSSPGCSLRRMATSPSSATRTRASTRGARPTFATSAYFERDFPDCTTYLLEQNYRSTPAILAAATPSSRRTRTASPARSGRTAKAGELITTYEAYNDEEEAEVVADRDRRADERRASRYGDIAVMYRTNGMSRAVEEALVRHRIPYRLIGGVRFYQRREIKDLVAYLRLVQNPATRRACCASSTSPPAVSATERSSASRSMRGANGTSLVGGVPGGRPWVRGGSGGERPVGERGPSFVDTIEGSSASRKRRRCRPCSTRPQGDRYGRYLQDGRSEGRRPHRERAPAPRGDGRVRGRRRRRRATSPRSCRTSRSSPMSMN